MTTLYKTRLIIDLDNTGGPIQATLELHSLDSRTVHSIITWSTGPFDTPDEVLHELIRQAESRFGTQPRLPD